MNVLPAIDLWVLNICCHWFDKHVSSSRVNCPEFQLCGTHGKMKLSLLWNPPPPFYDLFMDDTHIAKDFQLLFSHPWVTWVSKSISCGSETSVLRSGSCNRKKTATNLN